MDSRRNNPIKLLRCIRIWFVGKMEDWGGSRNKIGKRNPVTGGKVAVCLDVIILAAAKC